MLFTKSARYGTLNSARSAVALNSPQDLSTDKLISRFLKGAFEEKLSKPRYSVWDIEPVLNYIENIKPFSQLRLKKAAEKIFALLALAMAHRLQTLVLIHIDNITISDLGVEIKISDLIKTPKPEVFQSNLVLPFFKDRPLICSDYLARLYESKDLRARALGIKTFYFNCSPI